MKRSFFLIIVSVFAIFLFTNVGLTNAQEKVTETETPIGIDTQATQSSEIIPQRVNYELPYPGMLPDNPLYVLKAIRDGIVKFLINDPLKKAQFSLLVAEKRMFAGKLLIEKGEDELAITTISKSNNYLEEALSAIGDVKKQNPKSPDVKLFLQQFKSATLKHHEIAEDMKPSIDGKFMKAFLAQELRINAARITAETLLRQR